MTDQKRDILVHKVYVRLKKMIQDGELKPGDKLYQEKIAKKIGVSRTPLVKAFHILEQEMVLESVPGRGMYVRAVNIVDLLNAFECRQGIETTAVRILTSNISDKELRELQALFKPFLNSKKIDHSEYLTADVSFHFRLVQLTGNDYLIKMNTIANVFNETYKDGLIRSPEETLPEHLMILSAIETRNTGLAEEYMRNHLRKSIEKIRQKIEDKHRSAEH